MSSPSAASAAPADRPGELFFAEIREQPEALRRLLEHAGLLVDRVAAMGFPVFNLYRLAVIARGDRLIQEVASGSTKGVSAPARLAMGTFRGLFAINPLFGGLGWQIAAVATVPPGQPA